MPRSMMTLANLFAALTLVIAVFVVAPAADAATCAPDAAIAHLAMDMAHDQNGEHAQDGSKGDHDRMGGEIHGHCHHPGERQTGGEMTIAKPQAQASRYILRDDSTVSFASDRLKRPPRS